MINKMITKKDVVDVENRMKHLCGNYSVSRLDEFLYIMNNSKSAHITNTAIKSVMDAGYVFIAVDLSTDKKKIQAIFEKS